MSAMPASNDDEPGLILSLPPPKPYSLRITDLTIGAPPPAEDRIPLILGSVPIPSFLRSKKEEENGPATIVRAVSGTCGAGEMLAIIGGSGSGKTTLLNAIAGRLQGLPILDGQISFQPAAQHGQTVAKDGAPKVSKIIGFVRQNDYLLPHLTVRETLTFSAALRLPKTVDNKTVRQIVDQTIDELGLKECADTVVGGIFRKGISGGERRRLSIGCVLVTMPSVLILDEATTGLDATTSFLLLQTLSDLAKRHQRTIILSLHAPRSDAFALFDQLMVLSKGNVMYSGRSSDSLGWFEEHGCELKKETNPLDFLVDVTSVDNRSADREDESRARVATLVQAWKDREQEKQVPPPFSPIAHTISRGSQAGDLNPDASGDISRPGLFKQTAILLRRSHLNVYRNYGQLAGFLVQSIGIGVFMGLTYYDLQGNPADIQSLKGAAFQFFPGYFYLTQVYWIYKFCSDFIIFDREREDHLYSTFPYIIADFIAYLVPTIVPPTVYTVIFYAMSNMRRDDFAANLFIVVANCICMQWSTQGLALLASSIFRGFPQASMAANALSMFFTLSAGFSLTHVPVWLRWIRYISTTFYSFRVVATTQFKGRKFSCEGVTGVALTQCDGDNVLRSLGFSDAPLIVYFAAEIGIIAALYLLSGVILQFYKPGGVKHAPGGGPESRGKESALTGDMDIVRAKIDVEFRNIGFKWIRSGLPLGLRKAENKTILSEITTFFPAGEVSAILGPSGAGKSTLLQLLAHRKLNAGPGAHFEMTGDLLFNGMPATEDVRNSIAFVEQEDDYHLSALTVRETLRYAAILRLPPKMSKKRKIARAEEVLLMMGLKDCADIYVGGELLKGISGGEKRRLSLAVQMISDPSILVVDEPTSGLDSFIANNVMQCLKEIARSGRTVIVSIHQPRSDIFHSLDNMLILAKGGHAVFSGKREQAMHIMESQGYPLPSLWFNPADHLLDLVTVDQRPGKAVDSRARVDGLIEFWNTYREKVDRVEGHQKSEATTLQIIHESRFTPIYIAFPVVWERMLRNLWRQKDAFWGRLTQPPFAALMLLMFYERLKFGPTGGQDRIGVNLQSTGAMPFIGLICGIAVFPQDRQLFMHEYRSSAAYSCTTLILAYTLMELPSQIFAALLYAIFMNVAVGMQTSARIYFEYAVTIVALGSMGESIAIIFSAFFDGVGIAVSLVSTTLSMVVQFSGILSLSVPYWLSIIAWGTPLKAAQRLQFINENRGLEFHCSQADITAGICTAQSGEQLLELYSFHDRNTAKLVGITVGVAIAWRILAWAALRARMWRE
ncbi:P-loop containing nucleoside triphosphate hydrolase protein [Mycena albidolilacea]|uniref:P-loop containing nucleoside triphosphate hydrolase protein n=1 Tax=Mycena albidolilacea TaxID=1033008 RepID=A0AAD7EYC3_9AGAR|nr:P-loop containing nucleoside triphosphate hydrolase protein [Mycena albidolilacea]